MIDEATAREAARLTKAACNEIGASPGFNPELCAAIYRANLDALTGNAESLTQALTVKVSLSDLEEISDLSSLLKSLSCTGQRTQAFQEA